MTNVVETGDSSDSETHRHDQQESHLISGPSTLPGSSFSNSAIVSSATQGADQEPKSLANEVTTASDHSHRAMPPQDTQSLRSRDDHHNPHNAQSGGPNQREPPRRPAPLITSATTLSHHSQDPPTDHNTLNSAVSPRHRSTSNSTDDADKHPGTSTSEANKRQRTQGLSIYTPGSSRSLAFSGGLGDPNELICLCTKAPKVPRPRNGKSELFSRTSSFFSLYFFYLNFEVSKNS